MNIKLSDIIKWTGGSCDNDSADFEFTGVSTDSRSIKPGELFIPLVGENFNGHKFIQKVLENGAAGFLYAENAEDIPGEGIRISVNDTLRAFQDIACNYLRQFHIPVVAITGSNGKTTTKDILAHLLSQKYKVLKSLKNYNNEIGVPTTVMQLTPDIEVLIVELAMRGVGQIRELARIVSPDIALITNIGEAHFELLGSIEAIAQTKSEILEYLAPHGFAVLNADDNWYSWLSGKSGAQVVSFGMKNDAGIQLIDKKDLGLGGFDLDVKIENREFSFHLPLLGVHNIYNSLSAIAIAHCLRLSPQQISEGMKTLIPSDKRMEVRQSAGGWTVLNDSYNASPASTQGALDIMKRLPCTGRRIAVLGDMLELGEIAQDSHREVGVKVNEYGIDYLLVEGELGAQIATGARMSGMNSDRVIELENNERIYEKLKSIVKKGDIILVKGSRLMKMEEIAEKL
ncbi:MAG: UDP-N-acetylmuramoyl-tripeptide--D-alanyl-D-alanine ligase [Candidatus Eremiobacteraeota bacterium]|nr:UDP-N-acetylmuramoyl-tripeptide--D-alanyl-D-alanine ligase [Candidatus Eremiobacteraeota bacterium]